MLITFVGAKSERYGSHRIHAHGFGKALQEAGETVRFLRTPAGDEDVVIFAKGSSGWRRGKPKNPRSLVGVTNPEISLLQDAGGWVKPDFLVVASLEESDSVAFAQIPRIVVPHVEPNVPAPNTYTKKEKIHIVYHGNREHLVEASPNALKALRMLSFEFDFVLRLIYDHRRLGKVVLGIEDSVRVEHVQWARADFMKRLQECHIGWAPSVNHSVANLSDSGDPQRMTTTVKRIHNNGRALLMSMLGLPVVAEMAHSHFQLYGDSEGGVLAFSEHGWADGFRLFLRSAEARDAHSRSGMRKAAKIHSWGQSIRRLREIEYELRRRA